MSASTAVSDNGATSGRKVRRRRERCRRESAAAVSYSLSFPPASREPESYHDVTICTASDRRPSCGRMLVEKDTHKLKTASMLMLMRNRRHLEPAPRRYPSSKLPRTALE
eukprot:scaffold57018_cov48-Phaeocystis_antarctica.AAC.1